MNRNVMQTDEASDASEDWMQEVHDLRAALDEHAIVAITDPEGVITFVNDKFCQVSRFSRTELLGQGYGIINSGDESEELSQSLWQTISQRTVWHGEIRNRAKGGETYWLHATILPCLDKHGKVRQFLAVGADITEQKRVEAALAEKLRLQQLLAELSSRFLTVGSKDLNAAIDEAQRLIVETLGLDRSTLWQITEDKAAMILTHSWQRSGWPPLPIGFSSEGMLPWMHSAIMRGEPITFSSLDELPPEAARDLETLRVYGPRAIVTFPLVANGKIFGALAFGSLGADRTWRPDEILGLKLISQIIGNVVGRQRAEMREEQVRDELTHAIRVTSLGELAATMAHELNQPLAAILSNAQAARRFIADGEIDQAELNAILNDIVRDDKRAGAVIHNLRAMVSKRPGSREECSLNEVVQEVIALMHGEIVVAGVDVRLTLSREPLRVLASRVELQQVLVNLLLNAEQAVKNAAPNDRVIEVETREAGGSAVTTIRDHGPGIPPWRLSEVFSPFFSTKASGLGLGLSICRRIVENHAGSIEAHTHPDGGAVFAFSLPAL